MTNSTANFTLDVDLTNPGQFFACCGLLEAAYRLFPTAEGWFDGDKFHIRACAEDSAESPLIDRILQQVVAGETRADSDFPDASVRPVELATLEITLDWWLDPEGKKSRLKLWAGQQTSFGIVTTLCRAIADLGSVPHESLFNAAVPLTGRFGVDPRAAWNALDAGFSPNEQGMEVASYPHVELFAAIGLQRCRPEPNNRRIHYCTWTEGIAATIVPAAAAGRILAGKSRRFAFELAERGSYKCFDFATPTGDVS